MELLIIIISFGLGYGQGLRYKRKKTAEKVSELKNEIYDLKDTLKKEQRRNHLSMYDVRHKTKGDQSMLEEALVNYFSMSERKFGIEEIIAFFDYLITKWENEFINVDSQIRITDINEKKKKFMEIDQIMTSPLTIKVKRELSSCSVSLAIRDIFPIVIKFLQEINIENYDISYNEFIDAMKNVTSILL